MREFVTVIVAALIDYKLHVPLLPCYRVTVWLKSAYNQGLRR